MKLLICGFIECFWCDITLHWLLHLSFDSWSTTLIYLKILSITLHTRFVGLVLLRIDSVVHRLSYFLLKCFILLVGLLDVLLDLCDFRFYVFMFRLLSLFPDNSWSPNVFQRNIRWECVRFLSCILSISYWLILTSTSLSLFSRESS